MKLNKKGFTLVELLAVIVVLAIIALIGYTTVGNIITSTQDSADSISIGNYAKSIEQDYLQSLMLNNKKPGYVTSNGILDFRGGILSEQIPYDEWTTTHSEYDFQSYKGSQVYCDSGSITNGGEVTLNCCYVGNNYKKKFNYKAGKVEDATC